MTGHPCDKGARLLLSNGTLPTITDATLGRAKVMRTPKQYIICLIIKTDATTNTQENILQEALNSLLDVCMELGLRTISICKHNIDPISWDEISHSLTNTLADVPTKILACTNDREDPPINDRHSIIEELLASTIGGHKGVTKTYPRAKQKYHWPNMRRDIQIFISKCRNCQLKKLVRTKTRQPMTITDTPGTAFEKISMDIMGPLPTTKAGN